MRPLRSAARAGGGELPSAPPAERSDSYRRLAEVFHDVLSEQSLDTLLDRIADTLVDLVPHDTLTIYQADDAARVLVPVLARDRWASEILKTPIAYGAGLTGWATERREALQGLGWSARDADAAAEAVAPEAEAGADVPTLLRAALQSLART